MRPPRTLAEAVAVDTPDEVRGEPLWRWGWLNGYSDALAVSGATVEPTTAPDWLEGYYARQRSQLAQARDWSFKPRPKTAEQIRAEVAWSWRQAERQVSA